MSDFEKEIITETQKLNLTINQKMKLGKWESDILVNTSSGGVFFIEVKKNKISIPDILSSASMVQFMKIPTTSFSGTISTNITPHPTIKKIASDNNIAIINWNDLKISPSKYYMFIQLIVDIETVAKKLAGIDRYKKAQFLTIIKRIYHEELINDEIYKKIQKIWELRNKIIHNDQTSHNEVERAIQIAKYILTFLKKQRIKKR